MGTDTLVVARTDSEAATFLSTNIDARDHAFILGATVEDPLTGSSFGGRETLNETQEAARAEGVDADAVGDEWLQRAELKTFPDLVSSKLDGADVDAWRAFVRTSGVFCRPTPLARRRAASCPVGGRGPVPLEDAPQERVPLGRGAVFRLGRASRARGLLPHPSGHGVRDRARQSLRAPLRPVVDGDGETDPLASDRTRAPRRVLGKNATRFASVVGLRGRRQGSLPGQVPRL